MSYVEGNLIPGEKIINKTGLQWIVLVPPAALGMLLALVGVTVLALSTKENDATPLEAFGAALILVGAVFVIHGVLRMKSVEMAVTNRRVVTKAGVVSSRSFEVMLPKVESISIDEDLLGRMLGYGTVVVRGTGGTPEPFRNIAHPLEFRKQVQQHIELSQQPPERPAVTNL